MQKDTSRSTTPTKRMNAVIQSPPKGIRHTIQDPGAGSPPRTPQRRRKDPPSSYPKSARLAAATSTTFFDDVNAYERDSPTDDDNEDPHDLTYSSKHFPRASMVDNMVMALDQFSCPTAEPRYYDRDEDQRMQRARGHTFSSSVSSESDVRTLQTKSIQSQNQRLTRRSSARYARDPLKLPSIFGEDEDSTRIRIYEAQRAAPPARMKKQRSSTGQDMRNESASTSDLSHLAHLQGRLGPAGNRRSQSFDFGSRRPYTINDDDESAPHPVVYAGPESQRPPASSSLQSTTLGRRGSVKSAKNTRNKPPTSQEQVEKWCPPEHLYREGTNPPSEKKQATAQDSTSTPHGGFFKRLFSSSRHVTQVPTATSAQTTGPSQDQPKEVVNVAVTRLQKQSHKDSMDLSNKENVQPTISKKPSSFFRRRKKSVSTLIAPPVPLTLNSSLAASEARPGAQSPVSSLKAFMDPYLAEDLTHKRSQTPTSPLRTFYSGTQDSASTGIMRTTSPEPIQQSSRDKDRLTVPQKEAFLCDNSSDEDVAHTHSKARPVPRAASTTPAASTIRPIVEARSSSWHSDQARLGIPPRKDSLVIKESTRIKNPALRQSWINTSHSDRSGSDVSDFRSAPSTPAVQTIPESFMTSSPRFHVSHPSVGQAPIITELDKAQQVYNNGEDDIEGRNAAAWLGEAGSDRERIRKAYMHLFDWTGQHILAALRSLCSRLVLKAESQLIDRILDAFAKRWCDCNPHHGFKSSDVVHTICYSVLLLNTDLHMADIGHKMTRSQFVKNAMQTILTVVDDNEASSPTGTQHLTVRSNSYGNTFSNRVSTDRVPSRTASVLGHRPTEQPMRGESSDGPSASTSGPLINDMFSGSQAGWELQLETVLKDFYFSIQKEPLPLSGSEPAPRCPPSTSNNNLLSLGGLRRTPSVLSKAQSESNRSRYGDSKSLNSKWNSKSRSRPRLGSTPGFVSSKNSLEDQSSAWSPSMSSTWSKASLGKTLTSMSVDSFATSGAGGMNDFQQSIGFANALSQAIIREDQLETQTDDGMKAAPLLEDESLELEGAPWAKEGILKHKCHLEGVDKRSKDRNWNDCFAVIEKGWMRLFSFSVTAKSLRTKARNHKAGGVVGGGNWQDNAEEVWKFMLRHTIASSLPPPGYSKARPHVWALSLPTGAVHLFSVGTPDIVKEFVSTANFWSARLSKEPMIGGISSMEYGWSDCVINRALTGAEVRPSIASSDMPRPSTQMSVRSSVDHGGSMRPKLPGDKIYIADWSPPQQSLLASQLMEVDQLRALQTYVQNVEEDLQRHNELRSAMLLAFSFKHSNYSKAMGNWEKKSAYLLREIVKFKNYIDALQGAQATKERVYRMRKEEERQRQADDDSLALYASLSMGAPATAAAS